MMEGILASLTSNGWVLLFNLDRFLSSSKHLVGAVVRSLFSEARSVCVRD